MAIVLAILALLTHLAVVKLADSDFKPRQAKKQLEALRTAICGGDADLDAAGQPTRCGFVADMGRLPRVVADANGKPTLSELWQCPDGATFAVREFTDVDGLKVCLGCGWNGPYADAKHALDPWGNPFDLCDASTNAQESAGADIAAIRSLGSDGSRGWDEHTDAAKDLVVETVASASLVVIPTFRTLVSGTNDVSWLETDTRALPATLRVYSPLEAEITVTETSESALASGGKLEITGLTPGPRAFRIQRNGTLYPIHSVVLKPGPNVVSITETRSGARVDSANPELPSESETEPPPSSDAAP